MNHNNDSARARRHIRTAASVRELLADEIAYVTAHPDLEPLQRARVVTNLAYAALQAIKLETLEARVEALEQTLKFRNETLKEDRQP
jgi:hypothetical protein